jgi:anthranilate/para-aminobenzoate synthase component I
MTRVYDAFASTRGPCVLLESTAAPSPLARRSLLARGPRAALVADRRGLRLATPEGVRPVAGDAFTALRSMLRDVRPGRWPDEGGIAGALAYDAARRGEGAPTPKLIALAVDRFMVEEGGSVHGDGGDAGPYPWVDALISPAPGADGEPPVAPLDLARWSSLTPDEHRRLVRVVQEHIAAGDIYQANLSQRFELPWAAGGLPLYAALRVISPAPFAGYMRMGGLEIVSASPERLLSVLDGRATTRPLAGTRPRSADPGADRALAAELLLSEKERAEHLMLVDLARNDLGRVADIGSVAVDELMVVEEQSHVRHIVSNVTARMRSGADPLDALAAVFPGGTITGVPKIRCMEILDRVEPVPRGFYTGALFYLTPSGRLDANILIRSAVVTGGRVTFHAGGGIVADSDPQREYEETLHKAEGLKLALEAVLTESGGS